MTQFHTVEPFLPEAVPVEFAATVTSCEVVGHSVQLTVESVRFDTHPYNYYGSPTVTTYRPRSTGSPIQIVIMAIEGGAFRLLSAPGETPTIRESPMIIDPPVTVEPVVVTDDATIEICGDGTKLLIDRSPFRARLIDKLGNQVMSTRAWDDDAFARQPRDKVWHENEQRWLFWNRYAFPLGVSQDDRYPATFISFELPHDEKIWGFGEGFGRLDRRGSDQWLWLEEAYGNTSPASYKQTPFWITSKGYGVFIHSARAMHVRSGSLDHTAMSVLVEDEQQLDVFLIPGPEVRDIVQAYCRITGMPRVPPRWTLGFWLGRISYDTQEQVEEIAQEVRSRAIPCDVIHVDTNWFPVDWECDLEFSEERFPDVEGMFSRLRDQGLRVSLWQWPNLVVGSKLFAEADEKGLLIRRYNDEAYIQSGFVKDAAAIDYSHPEAAEWIGQKIQGLLRRGAAAIKVDFGEGAPPDGVYVGIDSRDAHNTYPLLYQKAVQDASDAVWGDEAVLWARAGWAGAQRYPVHWSGDGVARFEDLPCVLRAILSMGISGFPFYSHDVGGFAGLPDEALYIRWLQLGVFSSHIRAHGVPPREPWEYGSDAERISREMLELRYRLLPTIDASTIAAGETCVPVARALVWDFSDDPVAASVDDEYMFTESILVAPILTPSNRRLVYFPKGVWTEWWSSKEVVGGKFEEVEVPLDRVPMWIRENSLIALGPVMQHTEDGPCDPLTLLLYQPEEGQGTAIPQRDNPVTVKWSMSGNDQLVVHVSGARGNVRIALPGMSITHAVMDEGIDCELVGVEGHSGVAFNLPDEVNSVALRLSVAEKE